MKFRSFILVITLFSAALAAIAQNTVATAVQNTPGNVPSPSDSSFLHGYTLGPGDQVAGGALGEVGYDFVGTVDEDGMIKVPFIPDKLIVAQCRTERDIQADIEAEIRKFVREPHFSFRVVEKHSRPPVTVWGEVTRPSEITLTRPRTLVEILSVAQGIKEDSASGQIEIVRSKMPLCMAESDTDNWKTETLHTYSYSKIKDINPMIYPGDVIHVVKAPPVYVTGQVVGGQGVYLKENGLSLTEAIGMVGGPRNEADLKAISIYRLKTGATPDSKDRELIAANLKHIRSGHAKDVMLQPYDIIVIDKAKKSMGSVIAQFALRAGEAAATSFPSALPYRIIY